MEVASTCNNIVLSHMINFSIITNIVIVVVVGLFSHGHPNSLKKCFTLCLNMWESQISLCCGYY